MESLVSGAQRCEYNALSSYAACECTWFLVEKGVVSSVA